MTHPTQLQLSMYADAELPPDESDQVAVHVGSCEACQAELSALRTETEYLAAAMQADAPEDFRELVLPKFSQPASLRGFALANVATALLIWLAQFLWKTLFGELLVNAATWVTSIYLPNIYEVASATALNLIDEGTTMLDAYLGFVIVFILTLTALAVLLMRQHTRAGTLSVCLLAMGAASLALPTPVHALDIRRHEDLVTIAATETIDDTLLVAAETVRIEGTVTGDVIALGQDIDITGSVGGNLVTFAETIKVSGDVGGFALGAADSYTLNASTVGGDLWLAGDRVDVGDDVRVGRNAGIASESASVGANVAKDLFAATETIEVSGELGGDLEAFARQLRLLGDAHIGGNVRFRGDEEKLFRADTVRVDGDVEFLAMPVELEDKSPYATVGFYLAQLAQLAAAFLFGLALLWLVPGLRGLSIGAGLDGLKSAGIGAVALVSLPILAILVAVTLIGLPFAFIGIVAWLLGIYLATIVVGAAIGRMMMSESDSMPLTLLAGLATVTLVVNLPFVGGIIDFVLTLIGLGMLVQFVFSIVSTRGSGEAAQA
ncbi:MAG: zf-HC2 domain-containing protein [Gammaproteobacteria bacterium]|nr:zf-HC2 domain-containing protein [Gammaproteobacteria bacterium]